jgi:hypothetical protein
METNNCFPCAPLDPELPRAYAGCSCSCHRMPGVYHCVPCCWAGKEDLLGSTLAGQKPDVWPERAVEILREEIDKGEKARMAEWERQNTVPSLSHMHVCRHGEPPAGDWECQFCHQRGTWEHLNVNKCTHVYAPCPSCKQTPECAPDCLALLYVLHSVLGSTEIDPTNE